jgi:hypothetical protein
VQLFAKKVRQSKIFLDSGKSTELKKQIDWEKQYPFKPQTQIDNMGCFLDLLKYLNVNRRI